MENWMITKYVSLVSMINVTHFDNDIDCAQSFDYKHPDDDSDHSSPTVSFLADLSIGNTDSIYTEIDVQCVVQKHQYQQYQDHYQIH